MSNYLSVIGSHEDEDLVFPIEVPDIPINSEGKFDFTVNIEI